MTDRQTDGQRDGHTDRRTDGGQSDPLCRFASQATQKTGLFPLGLG